MTDRNRTWVGVLAGALILVSLYLRSWTDGEMAMALVVLLWLQLWERHVLD